jgi:2-keto-3-deoxy-L-rhamnonate aldolase RhmA
LLLKRFPKDGTDDARRVIDVAKYAPLGNRSISAGFSHLEYQPLDTATSQAEMNVFASTAFNMIETADELEGVDDIAAFPGCEALLVGSNDLASKVGTLGDWDHPKFIEALRNVGAATKKHSKIMAIAGCYHPLDIMLKIIYGSGAKWIVRGQDIGLLL